MVHAVEVVVHEGEGKPHYLAGWFCKDTMRQEIQIGSWIDMGGSQPPAAHCFTFF